MEQSLKIAISCDLSISEFDEMTPYEFRLFADVFQEKQKAQAEKDLLAAYMSAYFQRIEKLEPFENYRKKLNEDEPAQKKEMSMDDMLQKVMELHNRMNGKGV